MINPNDGLASPIRGLIHVLAKAIISELLTEDAIRQNAQANNTSSSKLRETNGSSTDVRNERG